MALKKLTEAQKARMKEENTKKMEEKNMMNNVENSVKDEVTEQAGSTMGEAMKGTMDNHNSDNFFKTEELNGVCIPITNLEIEIPSYEVIPEGRYKFITQNVGIDNNVSTAYGVKNKMWLQFHLDGEHDIKQKYNVSASHKSRFYEVYNALTGETLTRNVNLGRLVGIEGYCDIQHICMDNGDIFPRIVNIQVKVNKNLAV